VAAPCFAGGGQLRGGKGATHAAAPAALAFHAG